MSVRRPARLAAALCGVLLPLCAPAKDKPPAFHVASITYKQGGKLDGDILQACDVAQIVTDAVQKEKLTKGARIELVLRIDRVMKLRGRPPPGPVAAGTELGITILAIGTRQMDQPFLCNKDGLVTTSDAPAVRGIARRSAAARSRSRCPAGSRVARRRIRA